jgi:GAF domain-containing protein
MLNEMGSQLQRLKAKQQVLAETDDRAATGNLLSFYTRIMTKVTDCERCSVFINDPAHDKVWLKAGTGVREAEIEVPREGSIVGEVIATGKPKVISNVGEDEGAHKITDKKTGFVTRSILCVPIKSPTRDEVTGAFQLLNKSDGANFTDEDLSIANEIAAHLQKEVDGIFLDQEIFGFTERLYTSAKRVIQFLLASAIILFLLALLILGAWIFVPAVTG